MLYAGGSFGRRANPASDYLVETAEIVKAIGGRAPVKLMWTREDDTRSGFYRPMYFHTLEAALDDGGRLLGWRHHIVGQSLLKNTRLAELLIKDGVDGSSVEGAVNTPYAIPNLQLELTTSDITVPVLWWRSVGSSHTAFAIETFIDELAVAAGADPVDFRRALLAAQPRHLAALDLAVANSDWGKPLDKGQGRGRGIAIHETFNTVVVQIVEVSVSRRRFRVNRVVCAVNCGTAINPDVVTAQMEGGIGYALNAALYGEIVLDHGQVRQSNFHDYKPLRISEMPQIDVHIVASDAPPTGVGEPGVPPLAPALANAIAAATGQRLRKLPLRLSA
jgi:isoquinoline 1-oxidoreductase beta subunit